MKLNPPIIGLTVPAFTSDGIMVPFEMNPNVLPQQVKGFQCTITNIINDGNKKEIIFKEYDNIQNMIKNGEIVFNLSKEDREKLKVGVYGHIQLAYIDNTDEKGYDSTAAVIKYTVKPTVDIKLSGNLKSFTGTYQTSDINEGVYKYKFIIKDQNGQVFENNDWQIHNSINDEIKEINGIATRFSIDTFVTTKEYKINENYFATYVISTINNLIVKSEDKAIMLNTIIKPSMTGTVQTIYDKENACVHVSLQSDKPIMGTYRIVRADSKTNYEIWIPLCSFQINDNLQYCTYKDCTVEQGISYKYGYQQYNAYGVYSDIVGVTQIDNVDFEHMYLSDKDRQIKIAYNPKVSSFKKMILEQRTDTIGGKYPFYFRNGNIEYKEFPIAGLISYQLDEDEFFILRTELGFQNFSEQRNQTNNNSLLNLKIPTTNQIGYNFTAERRFKLELLDWLSNGEEKLFRSPQEGNYVIRLTGVNLTPNDQLSRMIHEFSATAYECGSSDISDIVAAGHLIDTNIREERIFQVGSNLIAEDLIINLPLQAHFETINIDGAFPTTEVQLIDKENNLYHYTIGQTGSLAISDLPAANTLSIANTPYPSGVINYIYSTPIGSANTDFDKITGVHTGATIGNENDLNKNITIIYKAIIAPINQESIIIINDNEEVKIRKQIELKNISSLSIPNNDATVIMYYQYCDVTYLQDTDEKLIQVGEIL